MLISFVNNNINSRRCDICNIKIQRSSYTKHFKSKKHLENGNRKKLIIPEWSFEGPTENKPRRIKIPKPLREKARDQIQLDDKHIIKQLAKKMLNLFYFTDRVLLVGFLIILDSHVFNLVNSKTSIKPSFFLNFESTSDTSTKSWKSWLFFMLD